MTIDRDGNLWFAGRRTRGVLEWADACTIEFIANEGATVLRAEGFGGGACENSYAA